MAMAIAPQEFSHAHATRDKVPLLLGLTGASSSGKTYSALRLATGIKRVHKGGPIFVIDTEANRSKHYADRFAFEHVPFRSPFGPLRYLAAIEYCVAQGAGVIIVDSMSHEHEGPGGVLEMHTAEVERMAKGDREKAERVKMLAWSKPKSERRRLLNSIIQIPCHFIFCFRAKEKLKIEKGKDPKPLGFMAIAGEEFIFEMSLNCLLYPNSRGIPTWRSAEIGESMQIKLPEQFRGVFADGPQLSEDVGEKLARWAEGGAVSRFDELRALIADALNPEELDALVAPLKEAREKKSVTPNEHKALQAAFVAKQESVKPPASADGEVSREQEPATREPGED